MIIHDEDINGGEEAARADAADEAARREPPPTRPESFAEARAFVVTASASALREMRTNLRARGFGDTPGLDRLIQEKETGR